MKNKLVLLTFCSSILFASSVSADEVVYDDGQELAKEDSPAIHSLELMFLLGDLTLFLIM